MAIDAVIDQKRPDFFLEEFHFHRVGFHRWARSKRHGRQAETKHRRENKTGFVTEP
jgi:hypothetical protein